jgi:predicted transposase/invertase (TIGR01784 family)
MKHRIDPKIDCVFKALLGSEDNKDLLIHFLNALLARELPAPISEVTIQDPHNHRESCDDKQSIVDVKAKDTDGQLFQVEIQLYQYGHLPQRIVYGWADIYSQQLQSGCDYDQLKPTYALWLLDENLLPEDGLYTHDYKLRDPAGNTLLMHGGIWLFELKKFCAQHVVSEEQRWLRFFKEGGNLDDQNLPDWMQTREMEKAMKTLMQFSEKENDYHEYQARQNFIREQRTIKKELEGAFEREQVALADKEAALADKEAALADKEAALDRERVALAENARLKALLEQRGKPH